MRCKRNKGFTLLELLVVVIVMGVLASVAVPKLFGAVEAAKASEAWGNIGAIRIAMEQCGLWKGGDYKTCRLNAWGQSTIGIDDPSDQSGYFSYAAWGYVNPGDPDAQHHYVIKAFRKPTSGGDPTHVVALTVKLWDSGATHSEICGSGAYRNFSNDECEGYIIADQNPHL